jgi:hypothetical protein
MAALPQPIDVAVLFTDGCANTPPTVALVEEVARKLDIQIRLRRVRIESVEQAEERKFLGSPTVLVNGLDIDPAARSCTSYGFV